MAGQLYEPESGTAWDRAVWWAKEAERMLNAAHRVASHRDLDTAHLPRLQRPSLEEVPRPQPPESLTDDPMVARAYERAPVLAQIAQAWAAIAQAEDDLATD